MGPRNHVLDGGGDAYENGQFWGLPSPLKSSVSH